MAKSIRLATIEDAAQIASIYSHFVLNTPVSFESKAPDEFEMQARITDGLDRYPWFVYDIDGQVAGYAYASRHRARHHYQWSVDVTVYVDRQWRRQGIGAALYKSLLSVLPLQGYVSAYAGITLPNQGSIALHESMGFTPVGVYRNVGYKLGRWHDVGWWQKTFAELPLEPQGPISLADAKASPDWERSLARVWGA